VSGGFEDEHRPAARVSETPDARVPLHPDPTLVASRLLGRPVHALSALTGGQHAQTTLVTDGATEFVVRTFPPGDDAVTDELTVLGRLGPLGALAPHPVAHGVDAGRGVLVTTALPGGPPPRDLDLATAARDLADALARIHALDGTGLPEAPTAIPDDAGSPIADRARTGLAVLQAEPRVLTHGDFWTGNAVWRDGRLAGVVDWSGARHAPRGMDVAWCRQDFVLLGAAPAADAFLARYEQASGIRIADVHAWDVHAAGRAAHRVHTWAPNYAGIGWTDVTAEVLRHRMQEWVARL
jgi:aminoglycoside phosphotransferase (APT) family kinase protein